MKGLKGKLEGLPEGKWQNEMRNWHWEVITRAKQSVDGGGDCLLRPNNLLNFSKKRTVTNRGGNTHKNEQIRGFYWHFWILPSDEFEF